MKQLGLFGDADEARNVPKESNAPNAPNANAPLKKATGPVVEAALVETMAKVPGQIRLGSSSWSFPGWSGIVWDGKATQKDLVAHGLGWLARHPLFRTVCIDRSYYAPIDAASLRSYAEQLPPGFRCLSKAPALVTRLVDTSTSTRERNPLFLDPQWFTAEVLAVYAAVFAEHAGPFVIEISPLRQRELPEANWLAERLDAFFEVLPGEFRYAVEFRNREFLQEPILEVLAKHGVARSLNFWERMPSIAKQLEFGFQSPDFAVARLMIPPGQRYADRKVSMGAFDSIQDPQPAMHDDVMKLVEQCLGTGRDLFIIANNKAEGCSPLTLRTLAERIAQQFGVSAAPRESEPEPEPAREPR